MSAADSFAVYLETAGPGDAADRSRKKVPARTVKASYERWSGKLTGPGTTPADVIRELGQPDEEDAWTLGYVLPTRSGYLYTFDFSTPARRLRESGFRRSGGIRPPPSGPPSPEKLAEIGAIAQELRGWIGEPEQTYGWWPVETWEYADGLVLHLRHGVVEAVESPPALG